MKKISLLVLTVMLIIGFASCSLGGKISNDDAIQLLSNVLYGLDMSSAEERGLIGAKADTYEWELIITDDQGGYVEYLFNIDTETGSLSGTITLQDFHVTGEDGEEYILTGVFTLTQAVVVSDDMTEMSVTMTIDGDVLIKCGNAEQRFIIELTYEFNINLENGAYTASVSGHINDEIIDETY
jgi:hypothetical protein